LNNSPTIFVVDDQEAIRSTIEDLLADESYTTKTFDSAEALLQGLQKEHADLVLLDIWLPGLDGVQALAEIKSLQPDLPVILMSGHAGIDVAVKGIKSGAADFLEKPLNLDILLEKVHMHLPQTRAAGSVARGRTVAEGVKAAMGEGASIELSKQLQKTLRNNAVLNGVGLLSGRPTGIIISPMPVDTGIVFRTLDGVAIPCSIDALEGFDRMKTSGGFTANSTVLTAGGRRVRTVEHLLAALHMCGVTNATIKVDEEIPNIDGSAADFCRIIEKAGLVEQDKPCREIVIHERIAIGNEVPEEKYIYAEPFDGFEICMRVNYPAPIFEQKFIFNPEKHSFAEDIAPARSFNTFENIDQAQKLGLAGSGYLNSHIIIHDGKVINTRLKYPDEFVRHKILDLLGDIYLLGFPLRGRIVANMTSHGLNQQLALKIQSALATAGASL
jgi:UDP-3-O-[3-hydroxymyristoyl] N-acetylglucosamine deacetylase